MEQKKINQRVKNNKIKFQANCASLIFNCSKILEQVYYKISKQGKKNQYTLQAGNKENCQEFIEINGLRFRKEKLKFQDEYEKIKKIGEGSQSVVYVCLEKTTGHKYAAKAFAYVDEEKTICIKEKFELLSSFENCQIIKPKSLFFNQQDRTCYMILEYCSYPTLREFITRKKGQINQEQAEKIIKSILTSLEVLNNNGVLHRDLKPQNLLYDQNTGNIKIIDFQTAKRYKSDIFLSTQTGSLLYRAPESFNSFYGKKIDVWAVGIIAFELLFNKFPFFAQSEKSTIKLIREAPLQFSLKENACSQKMKLFLNSLLEKDDYYRFSVEQALQFLDNQSETSQLSLKDMNQSTTDNSIRPDDQQIPDIKTSKIKVLRRISYPPVTQIAPTKQIEQSQY